MRLKNILRKLHLILGLTSGIVIFTVATSGCIYAFEEELRNIIHKDVYEIKEAAGDRKALSELVAIAKKKYPKQAIKSISVPANEHKSVEIAFKNKLWVYVNPYNGELLGAIDMEREFFAVVLKLHRNLCLGDTGKFITGCSALIFLFMLISGIILWWPANRRSASQKFSIKKSFGPRRLYYDLHSVLGFYASWILLFSALTGLTWSFKWAEGVMYNLSGSRKEERLKLVSDSTAKIASEPIDKLFLHAQTNFAGAKNYRIILPEKNKDAFRVVAEMKSPNLFRQTNQAYYDQYSGEILKEMLYKNLSTGDKIKTNTEHMHTGKVFGLPGKLMVFFAALIAASLPITGFLFWLKKS